MIGLMKHKVTFKKIDKTKDGRGGWTESPSDILTTWAAIAPLSPVEIVKYQSFLPEITGKMVVRYRDDIDSSCIVFYGSRKFEILGLVNPAEESRFLKILVKEIVSK